MKTLGLDLSTVASGWALFDNGIPTKYGVIQPDSDLSESAKYFYIAQSVATLLRVYRPTELAIEDTFFGKNISTLKKLSRLAGQMMYIWRLFAAKEVNFYMASSVRKSINVKGNAQKEEVVEAVNKYFKLRGRVKDNNVADAIVVGYHHWAQGQLRPLPEERRKARRVRTTRNRKRT